MQLSMAFEHGLHILLLKKYPSAQTKQPLSLQFKQPMNLKLHDVQINEPWNKKLDGKH